MAVGLSFDTWATAAPARRRALVRSRRWRPPARPEMAVVAVADMAALSAFVLIVAHLSVSPWAWGFVGASVALLLATGHYRSRITLNVAREARSVAACVAVPLLALAAVHLRGVTPGVLVEAGAVVVASMLVLHCTLYALIRRLRARGVYGERTLIIGAGQIGTTFATTLQEHREYGLRPIGFLDDVDDGDLSLPLFGSVALLRMVLFEERVDRVVVAFGRAREADMVDVLRACEDAAVDIHFLPRFFELGSSVHSTDVDDVWGFPLVRLRRPVRRRFSRGAKRALDVVVAGLGLLLAAPLYAALAVAVKVSSSGPVHFRQQRVGQRGETVEILKFRSMRVHSDSDTEWNISDSDNVVTGVGRVMRVLGLDEIPQLWNILRGDMSLVGPRPERPFFVEQFKAEIPRYDDRHRVPVGLTGLAQVHGLRGDTSIEERARFDNHYIENWSLWRDLAILTQTIFAVVRNVGSARSQAPVPHVAPSTATGGSDDLELGEVAAEPATPVVHESSEAAPIG
jgi:exopolysaccharide biosynthesis polyprenyl glycosylphosphotransferase